MEEIMEYWKKVEEDMPDLYSNGAPPGGTIYFHSKYVIIKNKDGKIGIAQIKIQGKQSKYHRKFGEDPDYQKYETGTKFKFDEIEKNSYHWEGLGYAETYRPEDVKEWKYEDDLIYNHPKKRK